jgi:DNA-binding GntR family transcriptional regulator
MQYIGDVPRGATMRGSVSLSEQAYELLKQDIVTCTIAPGERVGQAQLARRYGIGLTPTREAMQRLVRERFLSPLSGSGYLVSPISYSDVCEIYDMRIVLETTAFRMAVERGSDTELKAIVRAADFGYTFGNMDSYLEFARRNISFHLGIAAVSRNQRLVDWLSQLLDQSQRVLLVGVASADVSSASRDEHLLMAEFLCARDSVQGTALVRDVLEEAKQSAIVRLEKFFAHSSAAFT